MPKLPQDAQENAANASDDFGPLPDGIYTAKLKEVDDSVPDGKAGPQWKLVWEVTDDGYKGRLLFERMSLSKAAAFKVKEVFGALGYTLDSDTDEMIGDACKLVVEASTIQSGPKQGQPSNDITSHLSLNGAAESNGQPVTAGAAASGGGGDPWS